MFLYYLRNVYKNPGPTWVIKKENINRPAYIFTHPCTCSSHQDPENSIQVHYCKKWGWSPHKGCSVTSDCVNLLIDQNSPRDLPLEPFSWPHRPADGSPWTQNKVIGKLLFNYKICSAYSEYREQGHLSLHLCAIQCLFLALIKNRERGISD